MNGFRILPAGDAAFAVEFGDTIDRTVSERVLTLAQLIERAHLMGVLETIPTFRSLMVAFDPARVAFEALTRAVSTLAEPLVAFARDQSPTLREHRRWRAPACYHPDVAPDLEDAAARLGLSAQELAARHSAQPYHVYMLGFLPGQPYLGELPEALTLPRRETPRLRVEAGSIGVAMRMTCIFPRVTPCGLNIIARTPLPLWNPTHTDGLLLQPGDELRFVPVSLETFEALGDPEAQRAWRWRDDDEAAA